eukprot:4331276-Amphidinium_carterae.1
MQLVGLKQPNKLIENRKAYSSALTKTKTRWGALQPKRPSQGCDLVESIRERELGNYLSQVRVRP